MPTENTSAANRAFFCFGLALLLFLHLFSLTDVPGLHFDEAWAMNFSGRLADGEWTWKAMSPYTAPWAHYWAALWIKTFGSSLLVFRLSQVFLALGGIALLCAALWRSGRVMAASLLPLAVALLPGLVMNHRFAIELNGFHVFCFGLLAWSLVRRWFFLAAFAWVLGTTGHVLFYGVGLAVIGAAFWEGRELRWRERMAGLSSCLFLAAFFLQVIPQLPEKGKATALFLSAAAVAALLCLRAERWPVWRHRYFEVVVWLLSAVFLLNALFFVEGFWTLSITTGKEGWKGGRFLNLAVFLPFIIWITRRGGREFPRILRRAFLLGVICLGFMMLKPAPRYFELMFLALALCLAQGIASLPFLGRIATIFFLFLHATVLCAEYFTVSPRETELRFLFFKDSSRDFLSKQDLVAVLGGSGCRLSDIKSVDSRVGEALAALAKGDWKVADLPCRWKNLVIERRAESGQAGQTGQGRQEAADFVIRDIP